jgi:hypothetical protein
MSEQFEGTYRRVFLLMVATGGPAIFGFAAIGPGLLAGAGQLAVRTNRLATDTICAFSRFLRPP